jgi:hypothetical protein
VSVIRLRSRKYHLDIPVLMLPVCWGGEYCRNDYNINTVRIKYIFCALMVEIQNRENCYLSKKKKSI